MIVIMFKKNIIKTLLLLSVAVFIFGTGYKLGEIKSRRSKLSELNKSVFNISNGSGSDQKSWDFTLFWEAWEQLEKKFIDKEKLDPKKMFYGAVKGMVASLDDPYTFFLTPEENQEAKNDLAGKFEGIGAQLGLKSGRIIIIAPLKNSPALKAGVKAGDFINKVDGKSTEGWALPQAVSKIRGEKGTAVKLTLQRNSKEFDVDITRDQINVESVELAYEKKAGNSIAYLKLNQFVDTTNDEWDKAVDEIQARWRSGEIKGLVLDVRDNPGGYLESSVYITSEFIPQGKLIVKQTSTVQEDKTYTAKRVGRLLDIPLVILLNQGSASASEILAGALRDHNRVRLVGEKSFGKGSVQEATNLKEGAGLHITVAKWILPNGDWINSKGIEPDIKVVNKVEESTTLERGSDLQLDKAIEV